MPSRNENKYIGSDKLMFAHSRIRWTGILSALTAFAVAGCADNRIADRALGPNGAAARLGVTGASATWMNVTPANVNLTSSLSCGNYGTENVQVDPNQQSNFYAQFHCQGIWKSVDYGRTWTGPINTGTNGATVSDCAGGIRLAPNGVGNPPILYQACIRGAAIGFWRSLDGGVNWTRYTIAPAAANRQDVSPPSVDPYDAQHLIMAANGRDLLVESANGGQTWTSVAINAGMRTGGGTGSISFINTGNAASTRGTFLWMAQQSGGVYGTWRTTNGGVSWTQVDKNEHATGFAEAYQPDASGVVYIAGAYAQSGWGVMRSADYGATWTHVGSNTNQRTVFGTPSAVYSSFSYPTGLGATNGPDFQMAAQPGMTGWTAPATPAAMKQGASQAAVGFDGTNYSVVTANYGAGLWLYTVTASGTTPVPPPVADKSPSMTASTFTSTPDTVIVGSAASITITPRNAAGAKIGSGLVVTLTKAGGTVSDVLSAVAFVAADSTYRATLTPMGVAAPTTLTAAIGGPALPVTSIVVAKAVASTPPATPVTPGTWVNVTPANVNLTSSLSCGNYGTENVQVDPNQQSNFYAQFHCQGIWKSVDYGRTWTGPINTGTNGATVSDCAGGIRLAPNGVGNPPILYQACIRGAAIGFWRSLDGGVNWTRYTIAPAAGNRQDVYPPNVDPYDAQHLIMAGHEQDLLVESTNGGQTWTSVPINSGMRTGAGTGSISFIKTGNAASTRGSFLWMAQQSGGVYGTWRTTNGGVSWTQVDKNEHPHGFAEAYQPDASGVVYIAGAYAQSGWGVMRSADYGATWTHVGSNTNQRTVFGTPSAVYSSFSYPTGLGATNGPDFQMAAQPGMTGWTAPATPAAMKQGASQAAVGFDGSKYSIVTANYGAGLWLYTVAAGGATPVPPPVADKSPSMTASTFTSTPDTVIVGSAASITITPRNAAGAKIGSGLVVTLTKAGGTVSDVLSAVAFVAADSTYRAILTPFGVATPTTLTVSIGGSALPITRTVVAKATVAAPPPLTPANWTFCTKVGPYCEPFEGQRRDVRLVSTSGVSVTRTAFGFIACNRSAFQALPRGSVEDHCDYGKMQTEVVTNPSPGMSGLTASAVTVPLGDWGESTVLTRPSTSLPPAGGAEGNFRTVCNLVKMAAFDPIVYPGQPLAGHLHMFFGNVDVNPNSTPQSLAASGNSSCFGGIMNRTGYWVPAVFDAVSGEVQVPVAANFYYKNGILDPASIQPIPAGLRMIAGDKNATSAQEHAGWNCQLVWNQQSAVDGLIPNCAVGDAVVLDIRFPECWDGVNLDSPDHKSHMAYAIYVNAPGYQSYCPSTHPVPIPRITEIFRFPVTANSHPLNWRLTSDMYALSTRGGLSAHADWMDGWSRDGMTSFVKNCVNARRDCTAQLGDGRDVYYRR